MLIDLLIDILKPLIHWVTQAFPHPEGAALTPMGGWWEVYKFALMADDLAPIHECFFVVAGIVSWIIGLHVFKWTVKLVDWIADVIP